MATNLFKAGVNGLVSIIWTTSKETAWLDKQLKIITYLSSSFLCFFRMNGPSIFKPMYVKDGFALA